jgi:hypothetical protein
VAIATAEDALSAVVRPRLDAAGADLDRVQLVAVRRDGETGMLSLPGDVPALEERCRVAGVRFLVFDPVVAYLPMALDGHRDQHVRHVLAAIAGLAERCGLAAAGIMHLNKRVDVEDVLARITGSVAFGAAPRSVLLCAHEADAPEGPTRLVAHAKSNVGPLATTLRIRIEGREVMGRDGESIRTSGLAWVGEAPEMHATDLMRRPDDDEERSALDEAADWLRYFLADGPRPSSEVMRAAKAAGIAERTLRRAKERCGVDAKKAEGTLEGGWCWALASASHFPKMAKEAEDGHVRDGGRLRESWPSSGGNGAPDGDDVEVF